MRPGSPVLLAVLLLLAGCSAALRAGGLPPQATRKERPAGVETTALAVGATAPEQRMRLTDGSTVGLRGARTVLLFYRGQW